MHGTEKRSKIKDKDFLVDSSISEKMYQTKTPLTIF